MGQHDRPGRYSTASAALTIRAADLGGPRPVDIEIAAGAVRRLREVGQGAAGPTLEADGGAVLPGLHDHHVHLRALAATLRSVPAGPPDVRDPAGFRAALRRGREVAVAAGRSWVRAVGYHESVAGRLDRHALDAVLDDLAVRVQDRSGAMWTVNSRAVEDLGLDAVDDPGVERDAAGRPTGRLFRMDGWLRGRTGDAPDGAADLALLSREAAARGVTGFTDATPDLAPEELEYWARAVGEGALLQHLTVMWSLHPGLGPPPPGVGAGPVKILLDDVSLPVPDELAERIGRAHELGRPVAVHCVTRAQTVVTTAALARAGSIGGDRIEHGSLIPAELVPDLVRAGITVVTNPSLVHDRGDRYLEDVEPADRDDLYRCASLVGAGVRVAAGTDAPFGNPDPWVSVRAAVGRRTAAGAPLGPGEAVDAGTAVNLFLGGPDSPAVARRVAPGHPADLIVLDVPWTELHTSVGSAAAPLPPPLVRATVVAGRVVHGGDT
ncbi:MAG TPA: amidohydrolase family protein [Acidimicrobiales bacterium]|nr:amidohydrolase family protein [Acidimicrobiales bacterium]